MIFAMANTEPNISHTKLWCVSHEFVQLVCLVDERRIFEISDLPVSNLDYWAVVPSLYVGAQYHEVGLREARTLNLTELVAGYNRYPLS